MENFCTLYSHELAFDTISVELVSAFPKAKVSLTTEGDIKVFTVSISRGLFRAAHHFKISYRERKVPSYQIAEIDSPLTQNLSGMMGFVNSLPATNGMVKDLLLRKIETLNCEVAVLVNGIVFPELIDFLKKIAFSQQAIVFARPNTAISRSAFPHFVDSNMNLILDAEGNSEVDFLEVKINSRYFDKHIEEATDDQAERKKRSEGLLAQHHIKINANLPYIESEAEATIRSAEEIAERVVLLAITNGVAFNHLSGEQAVEYLRKYNLLDKATPKELAFMANPTEDTKAQMTWKCEGIWVLMWALQIVDDLGFPNELADLNNIPMEQYPVGPGKDPNGFIESMQVSRSTKEILDANDLYYRMDWACVDARITGNEISDVYPGVVYERHYALNWLVNYREQPWDEITCDT
jgi:hypothetical protein